MNCDILCYFRGLPFWLRDTPGIVFRSDNEPFKVPKYTINYILQIMLLLPIYIILNYKHLIFGFLGTILLQFHMKKFTQKIVHMLKKQNLYASQGGPIILSQVFSDKLI